MIKVLGNRRIVLGACFAFKSNKKVLLAILALNKM